MTRTLSMARFPPGLPGSCSKTSNRRNSSPLFVPYNSGEAVLSPRITAQVLQQLRSEQSAAQPDSPATPVAAAATAPPAEDLTPRELDVLKLMALGYSNTEIAECEFVSMATVKTHVRHILTKTGSRDRVHAVLYALTHGVVSVEELLSHP